MAAQAVAWSSLPPKAPPRRNTSTATRLMGMPSTRAMMRCTAVGDWVAEMTRRVSFSPGRATAACVSRYKCSWPPESTRPASTREQCGQARSTSPQEKVRAGVIRFSGGGGQARIEDRGHFLDLQLHGGQGAPGLQRRRRHHERQGLADVMDLAVGQQGFVGDDAADLVFTGDVGGGEHGRHARAFPRRRRVQLQDAAVGQGRGQHGGVEQPGKTVHVVDEKRFAAHVKKNIVLFHGSSPAAMRPGKSSRKWAASSRRSSARL